MPKQTLSGSIMSFRNAQQTAVAGADYEDAEYEDDEEYVEEEDDEEVDETDEDDEEFDGQIEEGQQCEISVHWHFLHRRFHPANSFY